MCPISMCPISKFLLFFVFVVVSQGFYSRWGQLAPLTKLQSFIRKRNRQKCNIDKQNYRQETVRKLSPCVGSTYMCNKPESLSM